jgi:hypothetical protein
MSGGSETQETKYDVQCQHCGLWYDDRGIDNHQANCSLRDYDVTLVDVDGDEQRATPDGGSTDDRDQENRHVDELDQDDRDVNEGPTKLDPPEPEVPDEPDDPDPSCPECGSTDWFDPTGLPTQVLDARPQLTEYDRCCYPCSTDDEGRLSDQIEAYDT